VTIANPTILIVEDNPTDVILIRRGFDRAKLANPIHVVGDGDSAVDYLSGGGAYADRQQFPLPVLILLDIKLPRRTGLEVLEWLRAQRTLKRIPVVVLTSSQQDRDVNAAYDTGANSYLVKPVEFDGLQQMIKTLHLYWLMLNERPRFDAGHGNAPSDR
jgi:CheY-like chemotaxis protein